MAKELDLKSSLIAGAAGGILLLLIVWMYDAILSDPESPLMAHAHIVMWFFFGAVVGFSVQTAERFTGAS